MFPGSPFRLRAPDFQVMLAELTASPLSREKMVVFFQSLGYPFLKIAL
jgi:hypothetical protein